MPVESRTKCRSDELAWMVTEEAPEPWMHTDVNKSYCWSRVYVPAVLMVRIAGDGVPVERPERAVLSCVDELLVL